jgi:ribulose-5-phosphate 4-epimerase/fuculose-1-phosphate aldolase
MSNSLWDARVDLAAAHRMAVFDGLNEGTWNHFSVTVPGNPDQMLVTPTYCHWKQVTASSLVLVDANGAKVEGTNDYDRSAFCIHYPIHRHCAQATCVLHAHPTFATALSLVEGGRLLMADQNALSVYGRVAYYEVWDGFVNEPEHGKRLADALGDNRVLVMSNHGVLVVGPTIAEAYTDLYQFERACMIQCHAQAMGRVRSIPHQVARDTPTEIDNTGYKLAHFAAMRRLLDVEQPDYVN